MLLIIVFSFLQEKVKAMLVIASDKKRNFFPTCGKFTENYGLFT
jgi:hypothetical protein